MSSTSIPVQMPGKPVAPPLSLYIHLPWCVTKCPYCDFNSHAVEDELPEQQYIQALRIDLESWASEAFTRPVESVFIGGGTPSLFSAESIETLLSDIRMLTNLRANAEITLEANPNSADVAKLQEYADAGINRISLGIQSLDDKKLKVLGRSHDSKQAQKAAEHAISIFERVNLDLITALPGQTVSQAAKDAEKLCALKPEHISLYKLTLEPGTVFFRKPPTGMPNHDLAADCEDKARQVVIDHGFPRYEISAHGSLQARSRHNINYWQFGDYIGIGAGAHSKLTTLQGIKRCVQHKSPKRYLQHIQTNTHIAESKIVTTKELPFEFFLNALRLVDGFDETLFFERTGLPLFKVESKLKKAQDDGLLSWECGKILPTPKGLDFHNDLCSLFLSN